MKKFKVSMWVGSSPTEVIVPAMNSANALYIARKMYPVARVIGASELKGL